MANPSRRKRLIISQEEVQTLFSYDADLGVLKWKARDASHFPGGKYKPERMMRTWNKRYAGTIAGNIGTGGYRVICIANVRYRAPRLIWLYVHGYLPDEIDHEFGVENGDSVNNMRSVTHAENMKNMRLSNSNTSGFVGVTRQGNKWRSVVFADGKRTHLGYFYDKNEAIKARMEANIKYGFHENHGRERAQ